MVVKISPIPGLTVYQFNINIDGNFPLSVVQDWCIERGITFVHITKMNALHSSRYVVGIIGNISAVLAVEMKMAFG